MTAECRPALASLLTLTAVLGMAGCRGSRPAAQADPEHGMSAVILGGKIVLPTGETRSGVVFINLEGEGGGREAEVYRLAARPQESLLYHIEPGAYRLAPTRSLFGFHQSQLKVRIEGRAYRVPFPRDILRKAVLDIRPAKVVSIGILEAALSPSLPGQEARLRVRLDDSVEARRHILQDLIRDMMDPAVPLQTRSSAVAWTRALDQALLDLVSESPRRPAYKPSP